MNNTDSTGLISHAPQSCRRGQRRCVVVVDDDPTIGCILAGALNRGGFDVEVFTDGAEALEAFDRLEPDLMVVDWIMPGLDGLRLIDALKGKKPDLPAMLITSYERHETVAAAIVTGRVDAVLAKPFNLKNFLQTVGLFVYKNIRRSDVSDADADKRTDLDEWSERLLVSMPKLAGPKVKAARKTVDDGYVDSWRALASRASYFEEILQSIIDAVLMVDYRGRIIYFNCGAERMFGFVAEKAATLRLADYCPPGSHIMESMSMFFKPHPPVEEHNEAFFQRASGKKFYAIYSISVFESSYQDPAVLLVIKDIHDRYLMEKQIEEENRSLEILSTTDPLTNIYNRRYFDRKLEDEFKRLERYNTPMTLLMIDFDCFKRINDTFGHLVGDKVLAAAASEFTHGLRDVDVLARWGGEEFMALLPETGHETGLYVVRRLHRMITVPEIWERIAPGLRVTVSIGMISLPWASGPKSALMNEAVNRLDQALYHAKQTGRNRIVRYNDAAGEMERV
jgi:diguanylate cyclase (GGDEF)-like protein/PAS domain S-box-containing protein